VLACRELDVLTEARAMCSVAGVMFATS